jgi:hypothetical protein
LGEKRILSILAATIGAAFASSVWAADVCQAPAPAKGAVIHGPVLAIPDGSSLCLATGASPSTWVRISLSRPPVTRPALMAAAFGKNATCVVGADGRGDCVVEGQRLATVLQGPEIVKAAYAWR